MRLKLFRAAGMTEAMRQVRTELGPEALILSSRRVADGVEITAGLEEAAALEPEGLTEALAEARRPIEPPAARHGAARHGEARHGEALAWHGASGALQRRLRAGPLPFALSAALRFAAMPLAPGGRPVLLAGPPGAGKTLTAARLATRLVLAGTMPLVISADGQRAGASDQLAAFTRVLGLDLLVASQPAALRRAMARREAGAPVLVDAAGCNPFDAGQLEALVALGCEIDALVALVLPAGMDPAEAGEMAAAHAEQGARLLVATRLDAARRIGSVLAAAEAGLALAEAGIGPGAADGMVPMTPALLAERLMQMPLAAATPEPVP